MTHQIILVEKNLTLDTMISLNLNVYVNGDVISKKNHLEAIELLSKNENISLIISRNQIAEEKTALSIYRFLSEKERVIPIIVLGPEEFLENRATILPEKFEILDLIKTSAQILGVTAKGMSQKIVPDYFPIPIEFFISISHLTCPTYIKMVTENSSDYIPRFKEGDHLTLAIIDELIKKGITTLYIPKEERLKFTHHLTNNLIEGLSRETLSLEERANLTSNSIEIVREQIHAAGLSEEISQLAEKAIQSMIIMTEKIPVLRDMLKKILSCKGSYRYRVAQLTTCIAFHAIKNLEWGILDQQDKIPFVALFHDITLEKDAWAMIRTEESLKKACLNDRDLSNVQTHASDSSKLVQNYSKTPIGAEIIIKQHHGSPAGYGYAKTYSNNLAPLSIVFIISEEYAHQILTMPKEQLNKNNIMKYLESKFTKNNYKKVLKSISNIQPDILD